MHNPALPDQFLKDGGRGGIRTPDTLSGTPVFKTGAINHSATLPSLKFSTRQDLSAKLERTPNKIDSQIPANAGIWLSLKRS
jgi:hypothetical protein